MFVFNEQVNAVRLTLIRGPMDRLTLDDVAASCLEVTASLLAVLYPPVQTLRVGLKHQVMRDAFDGFVAVAMDVGLGRYEDEERAIAGLPEVDYLGSSILPPWQIVPLRAVREILQCHHLPSAQLTDSFCEFHSTEPAEVLDPVDAVL